MTDVWNRIARLRDLRTGDRGDLWHRGMIDPAVRRLVGRVRGLRLLDLACGNGYLARSFAARGAREVVGLDRSTASIRFARARERRRPRGVRFHVGVATALPFPAASFDRVVANMALMDFEDAAGAIREVARVLAPGGRFVFSVCHPCFDVDDRSAWSVERGYDAGGFYERVYRKVRRYRDERRTRSPWRLPSGEVAWTEAFHRTLATYGRYLHDAGLAIAQLEEPLPDAEVVRASPQGPYLREIPLHLVVEAVPVAAATGGSRTPGRSRPGAARRSGSRARSARTGSARPGARSGS